MLKVSISQGIQPTYINIIHESFEEILDIQNLLFQHDLDESHPFMKELANFQENFLNPMPDQDIYQQTSNH